MAVLGTASHLTHDAAARPRFASSLCRQNSNVFCQMCILSASIQPCARFGLDAALNELPLGGAAQSARRFSFHFHIFVSASTPRCEVSEAPLRDILVVSGRSLTLGSFLLGWARSLDRRRTGPRLPSRPPSRRWQAQVQSLWQRALSRVVTSVAAGQRACECLRRADAQERVRMWFQFSDRLDACWFSA